MLKKKYRDMSMGRKFILITVVFLIIPLIIVFSIMNSVVANEILERQYAKELEILKQSKPSIEILLEDTELISRSMVANQDIQALYEEWQRSEKISGETLMAVQMYIEQMIYAKTHISSVSLYVGDKSLYQYGVRYNSEDIVNDSQKEKRVEGLAGAVLWDPGRVHEGYLAGKSNEAIISLYRTVNSLYKLTPIGSQRIGISEEYIYSLYGVVDEIEGETAYIFDENGYIVSSKEKTDMNKRVDKGVREAITSVDGYYLEENHGYAVFYYKLPINGWTVVRTKNMTGLENQIKMVNGIIWFMLCMAILFGIIFSALQKRTVVDPISKLAKDVENFDEDNYEIKLYSDTQDEVGRLNSSVIKMAQRIKNLIEMVYKEQIWQKEAEILSLQSQINPHFLYNTLDTMRWIAVEHDEQELSEQIQALSGMFRHVLNNGKEVTTVKEETEHLNNYLAIQKCRFGEKIKVDFSVDPSLYDYRVLKLVLQPMVENAFVHGLEEKNGGGNVQISVMEIANDIVYRVVDDGVGVEQEKIQAILDSQDPQPKIYGLKNVNDRIKLKYGSEYGVTFKSKLGQGTEVQVRVAKNLVEE